MEKSLRLTTPDEERRGARGTATSRTAQDHRSGLCLAVVEGRGGVTVTVCEAASTATLSHPVGLLEMLYVVEIRRREMDRHRSRVSLREEDGRLIESERTGHIVVAARDEKGRRPWHKSTLRIVSYPSCITEFQFQNRCKDTKKAG